MGRQNLLGPVRFRLAIVQARLAQPVNEFFKLWLIEICDGLWLMNSTVAFGCN